MSEQSRRPIILVADDLAENIDVMAGALGQTYEVRVALNGQDALAGAESDPLPDLVLLDIMMPDMNGYEVCRRLKASEKTRDIPVIFVTAMDEMKDEEKGFEVGAVDYVTKPIKTPIVLARIRAQLELRQAREDLKDRNRILEENRRLRDDVESIVRHDIKTPVSVFLWAPKVLASGGELTQEQLSTIQVMEQAAQSILQVLSRSVDLIKMERGQYVLQPANVDVVRILRHVRSDLNGLSRTKNLTVDIVMGDTPSDETTPFFVRGEEVLLYSMLANLLKNALEAAPNGSRVLVTLGLHEAPTITIHNKGTVPSDIRDRFFEKYVTSTGRAGAGLGTYSARLMAETQGGSVRMTTSEQEGTSVVISLTQERKEHQ